MDEDRIAGSAERARGAAKESAGNIFGDSKLQMEGAAERTTGTLRDAAGSARDAAREAEESPEAEVRHLRQEVDEISAETAAAKAQAETYARKADAAVNRKTDAVADVVRDHPLAAVGGAALAGFLLARLTAGTIYVYRR